MLLASRASSVTAHCLVFSKTAGRQHGRHRGGGQGAQGRSGCPEGAARLGRRTCRALTDDCTRARSRHARPQANPELLHAPQMKFLKEYIESFGGTVPAPGGAKPAATGAAKASSGVESVESDDDDMPGLEEVGGEGKGAGPKVEEPESEEEPDEEEEPEEEDPDVMSAADADVVPPQENAADPSKEPSDADYEVAGTAKAEAMDAQVRIGVSGTRVVASAARLCGSVCGCAPARLHRVVRVGAFVPARVFLFVRTRAVARARVQTSMLARARARARPCSRLKNQDCAGRGRLGKGDGAVDQGGDGDA